MIRKLPTEMKSTIHLWQKTTISRMICQGSVVPLHTHTYTLTPPNRPLEYSPEATVPRTPMLSVSITHTKLSFPCPHIYMCFPSAGNGLRPPILLLRSCVGTKVHPKSCSPWSVLSLPQPTLISFSLLVGITDPCTHLTYPTGLEV